MSSPFVHLRAHSYYSFLEGLASPASLAQAACDQEMPALGLTDHRSLSGAVEFYTACLESGLRPLLGLEMDITFAGGKLVPTRQNGAMAEKHPARLALLACDLDGWRSLCRLSSALQDDPQNPGKALPFERLAGENRGLVCLTGGRNDLVSALARLESDGPALELLGRLGDIFPGRLYVELQLHTPADQSWVTRLARLAGRSELPTLATHAVYYLAPEHARLQSIVSGIRLNRPNTDLSEMDTAPPQAHFLPVSDMLARFEHYPRALANTLEVAERCRLELSLDQPLFPELDLPGKQTPLQVLREKATAGAVRLYGALTPSIQERLDHELAVIGERGYAPLFLVMEEIVQFARENGIPISSRGSAASSLAAHCLGITSPDPLRLDLYFERFLNPARLTPPDIDTDLCSRRRDEVIDFVYRRFGQEKVAMVCTVNRFRPRSALRDVAKAHGLSPSEVSRLAEALPFRWYGPPGRSGTGQDPYAELSEAHPGARYQAIFEDSRALIGAPRHLSVHPGGIVIAPGAMTDWVPTQMAAKGVLITQLDLDWIERLGLVKIDLLGIRGLTVLGDVAAAVGPASPVHPSSPVDFLEQIPTDDPETSEMVRQGRTIGCFQIESPGMRLTLREVQARSVDDVMVALALYRPGPLTGGLKDAFVRRHRGQEPPAFLHPALEPLLADTYGVILYQEQVLRLAHGLAGLSLSDADLLRRAMSHFDPGKQMQSLKERFIAGAWQRSGVPEAAAERIWELMAAFAGYGFPKAHAASYAQVAWRSAWCKAHHPAIFLAAVLANWGGYYSQRVYLTEARRLGLAVRPPEVNFARPEFSVSYLDGKPTLFMGLDQVRDLTRRTQARILRGRPFHSLADFLARVDPRPGEAENLARAGALGVFGSPPAMLSGLKGSRWQGGQLPLFSLETGAVEEWSLAEQAAAQEAVLGASLAAHPLELAAAEIAASAAITTLEAAARIGQKVRVAGMRQTWRRSLTSKGDTIYFMALEDLEGMLDVVIFADAYRRSRREISGAGPYVVEGVVEFDPTSGEPTIRAEHVWALRSAKQ